MDQARGRHSHDGRFAGVAAVGNIEPHIAAEGDFCPVGSVDAGGIFQAEEQVFGEQRLSEAAERKSRHAPFVAGRRHPFEKQRALLGLGDAQPLAGEEIAGIELVDQVDAGAARRREVQRDALAAGRRVRDIAAGDVRFGGGEDARILTAEAVAHAFVIQLDFELFAAQRVRTAADLIQKLPRADVAIGEGDGALQVVVGQHDGGSAGADFDRSGGGEGLQAE